MAASPPDVARCGRPIHASRPAGIRRRHRRKTGDLAFSVWRNARGPTRNAKGAASMRRRITRLVLYAAAGVAILALVFGGLVVWPSSLFAFSLTVGRIVVSSDRPIPAAGAERVLRDCQRLL